MKIEKNKVVSITYVLDVDGKVADTATEERPLDYIHGNHMLLPKFEQELEGLEPESEYAFTLSPEEGYGKWEMERVFDLPIEAFQIDGKVPEEILVVGRMLPMLNGNGQVVQGLIKEIKDNAVTMDFNHPMAGKTLNFKGKVLSVRDATEKELKEGLHGEFLPPEEKEHHCHKHGKGGHCCHEDGKEGDHCCHEGKDGDHCCHEGKDGEHCCHKDEE